MPADKIRCWRAFLNKCLVLWGPELSHEDQICSLIGPEAPVPTSLANGLNGSVIIFEYLPPCGFIFAKPLSEQYQLGFHRYFTSRGYWSKKKTLNLQDLNLFLNYIVLNQRWQFVLFSKALLMLIGKACFKKNRKFCL
jgi:hypothetical protein